MKPYVEDADLSLYVGDAAQVLRELPERSVHCVLTSPPFFGLRNYQTGRWEGGDPEHEHDSVGARGGRGGSGTLDKRSGATPSVVPVKVCSCGAEHHDAQIGLEDDPDQWAERLVEVFREARRVLRDDGTLWIECGDSYASQPAGNSDATFSAKQASNRGSEARRSRPQVRDGKAAAGQGAPSRPPAIAGIKQKDIIGAPFLLAFALRADGWFWRGCYIWEKPDAMPESATDRCTVSHSYLLHFSKSSRYFHDQDAIREAFSTTHAPGSAIRSTEAYGADNGGNGGLTAHLGDVKARLAANAIADGQLNLDGNDAEPEQRGPDGRRVTTVSATHNSEQHRDGDRWPNQGRNARSVWRISTEATSFGLCPECRTYWDSGAPAKHCGVDVVAHFATWPHALVGRIVACATSEKGCCPDCGAPWEREREREPMVIRRSDRTHELGQTRPSGTMVSPATSRTVGWLPTCDHGRSPVPSTVMDVFGGSGTTARQARAMGRRTILIELSPDYAEIAMNRTQQLALLG